MLRSVIHLPFVFVFEFISIFIEHNSCPLPVSFICLTWYNLGMSCLFLVPIIFALKLRIFVLFREPSVRRESQVDDERGLVRITRRHVVCNNDRQLHRSNCVFPVMRIYLVLVMCC